MRKRPESEWFFFPRGQVSSFFYFPSPFCSVLSLDESVKAMSLSAEEDDVPWDGLRDNRDLTVFTSWDPKDRSLSHCSAASPPPHSPPSLPASVCVSFCPLPRRLAEEHRRLSLEEETVWLRVRSLTLRLVAAVASPGHAGAPNAETSNENGIGDKASTLGSLLAQLNQTLQTGAQLVEKHVQVCRWWVGGGRGQWRLSGGSKRVCFVVVVPLPGTALHALGPSSVRRELPVPGRSPPAVRPPPGAGAARARSEPPPLFARGPSEAGRLGDFCFCFPVFRRRVRRTSNPDL